MRVRPAVQFGNSAGDGLTKTVFDRFDGLVQCNPRGNGAGFKPTNDCTYFEVIPFSGFSSGTDLDLLLCARYTGSIRDSVGLIDETGIFHTIIPHGAKAGGEYPITLAPSHSFRFAFMPTLNSRWSSVDSENPQQSVNFIAQKVTKEGTATMEPRGSFSVIPCPVQPGDILLFIEDGSDRDFNDLVVRVRENVTTPTITPILECVSRHSATDYSAHFGYLSLRPDTLLLGVSTNLTAANFISPPPQNRQQLISFAPGRGRFILRLDTSASELAAPDGLRWVLGRNNSAAATTAFGQRCSPLCSVINEVSFEQCQTRRQITATTSTTLNNNNSFSAITWTTTCPGHFENEMTLAPTLVLDDSTLDTISPQKCKVTLSVTDDTSFGGPAEIQSESCESTVRFQACVRDCFGVPGGQAQMDECGVCGGDNSSCKDCRGIPNGGAIIDQCGVCGGNNKSCVDCRGIPNGQSTVDICGQCGGDGSNCERSQCAISDIDPCGVCSGTGLSCLDCRGIPNGLTKVDACGVCGGNGASCRTEGCMTASAPANFTKNPLRSDFDLLTKRAIKYIQEASQCRRERLKTRLTKVRATTDEGRLSRGILSKEFGRATSICPQKQCIDVSTGREKRILRQFANRIYSRSATAQRAVAKCRKPIGRGSPQRSSKDIYNSILRRINQLPGQTVFCP